MRKTVEGAELATRFVNLKNDDCLKDFLREYGQEIRPTALNVLNDLILNFREAWEKKSQGLLSAEDAIERVLFHYGQVKTFGGTPVPVGDPKEKVFDMVGQSTVIIQAGGPFDHPAFRTRIGQPTPQFEPRDILDKIASTILKASAHGLLRMCKGHSLGWPCPQHYLVADEQRRVYCYKSCGDQAKSEAKKLWHKEHPGWKKQKSRRAKAA